MDPGQSESGQCRSRAGLGTLCVALSAMGWGTWTLFLRGSGLPAPWQAVLILAVMAAVSLPSAISGGGRPPGAPRGAGPWLLVALLGLLDAGNFIFFFSAVDRGPIAVAVLTHYLAPVIVAALAPALLREPLGRRTPPALLLSLGGLALLVASGGGVSGAALPAALLGGASAIFYGLNTLLSKKLLERFSGSELLSAHSAVAGLLLLPVALARAPMPPLHAFLGRPLLGALLIGGGCGALFLTGLRRIPAQLGSVLTYLEPLVASAVGALAFHEALTPLGLFGGALIVCGGAAVALQPASRPSRREAAAAP